MPLDPAFVADCPYGPEAQLIDEVLEVEREGSRIRVSMPTHPDLPLTRHQRAHPVRHPRHVAGGLMVHLTGILGFAHAYYVLDLRHADGWIGYGVRIHDARFTALARPGDPMVLEARATRVRRIREQLFVRYAFRFTQGEAEIYRSEQSAAWQRITDAVPGDA